MITYYYLGTQSNAEYIAHVLDPTAPTQPSAIKKDPFVPSPRVSGFCWSPHGYLLHFNSAHMTHENIKGVELYSKAEITKFLNENKDKDQNKAKLNSEQKHKRNPLVQMGDDSSDSDSSHSSQGFRQSREYDIMLPYEPTVFKAMALYAVDTKISYSFARLCTIEDRNIQKICNDNMEISIMLKRPDLAKIWKLVSVSLSTEFETSVQRQKIWKDHPTGWRMVKRLLDELEIRGDVQQIAMIGVCMFKANEVGNKLFGFSWIEILRSLRRNLTIIIGHDWAE